MDLILMRHLESEKNLKKSFASLDDQEPLTEKGKQMGIEIAADLKRYIDQKKGQIKQIYCASSNRGISTATLLSSQLGVPIVPLDALCSSKTGVLQGKTEEEVQQERPEFMHQPYLYRKGVISSYEFELIEGKETKSALESRVNQTIENILAVPDENIKIIVMHRSSLTAALIHYARLICHYPENYFGYIPLDYGYISHLSESEGKWKFESVNEPPKTLLKKFNGTFQ